MEMAEKYPINVYSKYIPWEIPIQLCIQDFLTDGNCAFDVGANIGGISIAMSRIVGLKGLVYSFEANPFLLPRLKRDLDANGATNVKVINKAVWSKSGELLPFYCDDSYYASASSLINRQQSTTEVFVETITIDDFCAEQRITPDLIKIDVEGAEYNVLQGAKYILEKYQPVVILEYSSCSESDDPIKLLSKFDYVFYDVNLYSEVNRDYYLDNFSSIPLVNILAIPRHRWRGSPYESISMIHKATIDHSNSRFRSSSNTPLRHQSVYLAPGRYKAIFDFDGPDAMRGGLRVYTNETNLGYYEAELNHLKTHACSHIVFEIAEPKKIQCQLVRKSKGNFIFNKIEFKKIQFSTDKTKHDFELQTLKGKLAEQKPKIPSLRQELKSVYNYWRWRYITKFADLYRRMRHLINIMLRKRRDE
jgi:FkbM family methyltransferase